MRRFEIHRDREAVAEGVEFSDGAVCIHEFGCFALGAIYRDLETAELDWQQRTVGDGCTFVMLDEEA